MNQADKRGIGLSSCQTASEGQPCNARPGLIEPEPKSLSLSLSLLRLDLRLQTVLTEGLVCCSLRDSQTKDRIQAVMFMYNFLLG